MAKKAFDPVNRKITRKIRIAIMISLITSFFIIAPVIILYTAGYRYDFKYHKIKQTGVLSIDVEPNDALVYLNSVQIKENMPIRLTNRAPGSYHVYIEKAGFKKWEKNINIESNKTTYIKDIELLKESVQQEINLEHIPEEIFASAHSQNFLYISKSKSKYEVYSFDSRDDSSIFISSYNQKPEISVSPFHASALIISNQGLNSIVELYDLKNQEITQKLTESKRNFEYQWSKRNGELYIKRVRVLSKTNISGSSEQIGITTSSVSYIEFPETIWQVKENTLMLQKNPEINYPLRNEIEKIIDITKDRFILQSRDKFIVINRNLPVEKSISEINAKSFFYQKDTEEWWFWSDHELWSIYKNGDLKLLSRHGNKIKSVSPLDEYGLMLFVDEKSLQALNPGFFPNEKLYQSENIEKYFVNTKERNLYFVENDKLFKLEY